MNYIIKYSYIQVVFLAALLLVYARKNLSKQATAGSNRSGIPSEVGERDRFEKHQSKALLKELENSCRVQETQSNKELLVIEGDLKDYTYSLKLTVLEPSCNVSVYFIRI
jgi:hypothetical protein